MIEMYLRAFVNWEQINEARLLAMTDFVYNNAKNASTRHTQFELNCNFYPQVLFREDINPHPRLRSAIKPANELNELMEILCQNLFHA